MQRKTHPASASSFALKDRSNQEIVDGAKHLVGRNRTVTAHLIAHLAEIYARKLHVTEGFSYLGHYCMAVLEMSEDEAHRRAHAAVLAQKYPVILDMLLEGSIHLTTLRIIGKCLMPKNHQRVLEAARGKNKTELEHLAAALCPKPDVPAVLRKLPEPRPENVHSEEVLFTSGKAEEVVPGAAAAGQTPSGAEVSPEQTDLGIHTLEAAIPPASPSPPKSRLAPLSPQRYNLQVTVDKETYEVLKQLQDLLRHQVRNGDLARIIKDALLERLEQVKREKFGHKKRPRKAREQESWIEEASPALVSAAEKEPAVSRGEGAARAVAIAPGRSPVNNRHIPNAVKRDVWQRDKGRCAFVSRNGRRCSEKGRLEFHHIHAYALGGPATLENIALRCRTHNAYEGVALFGEKTNRPGAIAKTEGASMQPANGSASRGAAVR